MENREIKIIRRIKVTFMHDSGEVHSKIFTLDNPSEIEDMANQINDYHVMEIKPVCIVNINQTA